MESSGPILAATAALAVLFTFWGVARLFSSPQQAIDDRLQAYSMRPTHRVIEDAPRGGGLFNGLRQLLRRDSKPRSATMEGLAGELARADAKLTPGEFRMLTVAFMILFFVVGVLVFRHVALGFLTAIVGYFVPKWYLKFKQGSRLKAFNEQLGDALMLLANSLRSGYGLTQAIEHVGEELSPPLGTEFLRVVREIGLGLSTTDALENLLKRVPSDDLDLMVTAITIQHEVGGNLAEVLDTISHTIRERVRVKGEIQVLTASQRLSALIITMLPVGLAVFLQVVRPDYISTLYTTTCGLIMLGVAIAGILSGYLVMRKITAIEV